MGYVMNTQMSKFISANDFKFTAGTWTPTLASNVVKQVRSAADAVFGVMIPVDLPDNAAALAGCLLKSIDVFYAIGTAACDDFATVELEKMTLGVDDVAITGAAVTGTCDAGHDTAAKRYAVDDDHVLTFTITTPFWIDDGDALALYLYIDAASTSVVTFFGARANFTLRV